MRTSLRGRFHKLEAVAPGIFGVKTTDAWDGVIVGDFEAASEESLPQFVEVAGGKSGMRLLGGAKILLDPDMELLGTALEPAAASRSKWLRLFNFAQAQERAVEISRGGFAAFRSSNLKVIELCDRRLHSW